MRSDFQPVMQICRELMNLIERTPVTGAKKMAFESVLKLAKAAPHAEEFLQTYLLKVLRSQPDLRK